MKYKEAYLTSAGLCEGGCLILYGGSAVRPVDESGDESEKRGESIAIVNRSRRRSCQPKQEEDE